MSSTANQPIVCRAAVCYEEGKPLAIEQVIVDPPSFGQIRVKVISAGICASDAHYVWGSHKYSDFPGWKLPTVLGHEGACIVESVGPGVTSLEKGDYVLTTFVPQCNNCRLCQAPTGNMCALDNLIVLGAIPNKKLPNGVALGGMAGLGIYSEYATLKQTQVQKIDKRLNMEHACILSCAIPTGFYSATYMANVYAGSICAVWGVGAIGLNVVLGCKYNGAQHIIGIDTEISKMDIAFEFGCTEFINPIELSIPLEQYLQEKYGGVNFAFECVGNEKTIHTAFKSLSFTGTLVLVGMTPGEVPIKCKVGELLAGRKIMGGFCGNKRARPAFRQLGQMVLDGKINLERMITKTFTLDQINDAFEMLRQGKCLRTVVVLK